MPRPVTLFTGAFHDLPLAELAAKAAAWGYAGVELTVSGDHLDVQRALGDAEYCSSRLALLSGHDLQVPAVSNFRVGQAVCDVIDAHHQSLVPDHVWGDGEPSGVRERAAQEMIATVQAAQRFGAAVVCGFSGSPVWAGVVGYPGLSATAVAAGYQEFAAAWHPILDACAEAGVRFALEIHPGQVAFDFYSAERTLDAIGHRSEFGFCLDPAHFHWQGMDPAVFVRHFGERVYHVHLKDAIIRLDGKTGLLNSYFPYGDPRRGWDFRSPGRGGIDWEAFIRALNDAGYDGPLSVDWRDEGLNRDFGAEEACRFARQLDFPARAAAKPAFR